MMVRGSREDQSVAETVGEVLLRYINELWVVRSR